MWFNIFLSIYKHFDLFYYDNNVTLSCFSFAPSVHLYQLNQVVENNHKRFIFYYYFALNFFAARDRIKLPACVIAAVRHKYPQANDETDYVGHIDY